MPATPAPGGVQAPAAPATGTLPTRPAPALPGVSAANGSFVDIAAAGGSAVRMFGLGAAPGPSSWGTMQMFGPANMATLTSAGLVPLSGPGYGVSGAPVMRSAVSVTPLEGVPAQVWWGAGLVALAGAAGVAFIRMRKA